MNQKEYDYEYDFEYKMRVSSELANVITSYMVENELTFEILDIAYEDVKEVYNRNAIIRRHKLDE